MPINSTWKMVTVKPAGWKAQTVY